MSMIASRRVSKTPTLKNVKPIELFVLFYQLTAAWLVAAWYAPRFLLEGAFFLAGSPFSFHIPPLLAAVYLASGFWVFRLRRDRAGLLYSVFAASSAVALAGFEGTLAASSLTLPWLVSIPLAGGSLLSLGLVFPDRPLPITRRKDMSWVGLALGGLSGTAGAAALLLGGSVGHQLSKQITGWFAGLCFLAFAGAVLKRSYSARQPSVREQSRLLLLATTLAFGPLCGWLLLHASYPQLPFSPYLLAPAVVFPPAWMVCLLRTRPSPAATTARQAGVYLILAVLTATSYALLTTGAAMLFGSSPTGHSPYMVGLALFITALMINPVRERMQASIESGNSKSSTRYRELLEDLGRDLAGATELSHVADLIRRYAYHTFRPSQMHVYIFDPAASEYTAAAGGDGKPTSDFTFPVNSPFVRQLSLNRSPIFLETTSIPAALSGEANTLLLLNAGLFAPFGGQDRLKGWIALGDKRSGEPYLEKDIDFLTGISELAAQAVERTQVISNLERRMHEMNVLSRISHGVNVTLAFDDILELLYAQTNQIIPTLNFSITLIEPRSRNLYHVFYLENDERFSERENIPLPPGTGLEEIVIHQGQAILTASYDQECRIQGVLPAYKEAGAWMAVPLNSRNDTIGSISLWSRDTSYTYKDSQLNLLHAIADQAAGAIVKGRLLQETEHRAYQLKVLNEVARSLTSTLDLRRLLDLILTSAVEFLNCEAGSLLLVDENTNELVFEAAVGPVALNLIGQSLPYGTGLVGKAVETRLPILANEVHNNPDWFSIPDQETGFQTRDLLVIPMMVKDRVIGVIEIINRNDSQHFTYEDQELLAAFTSQAAIALENARLYKLTDEALASRVDELSAMQRIDRELNSSLDTQRAMQITLSWALSRSGAEAGLVGSIEHDGLRVAVYSTTDEGLQSLEGTLYSTNSTLLQKAAETGQIQWEPVGQLEDTNLLQSARSRLAVPIHREAEVLGILLLESSRTEPLPEETLAFLSRLVDHAAIAISNAQLYSAVQDANLAKSKFISFVAHELKNPMSSIKGYTELVANGMAGPVNDMQSSFLGTVASNVDRMNTIVSDLNDLTKIEIGNLQLEFKAVQVSEILDDVLRSLRRQVEEKNIQVQIEIPRPGPIVWGDPTRLNQVLTNLISNAVKYSHPAGKVIVGGENYTYPPGSHDAVAGYHLWVRDSGIGIPDEDQGQIFQQYYRTAVSKETASGTGLGLHITKTLVEMQGGSIWFESKQERGSTFHITIPLAEMM